MTRLSDFIGESASGIPEPPNDSVVYGRTTIIGVSSWSSVWSKSEADGRYALTGHNHDGVYGRLDSTNTWLMNQLFSGRLGINGAAINTSYAINTVGSINLSAGSNFFINGTPVETFVDAPNDGNIYGRQSLAWVQIDAGGGGTVTNLTNSPSSIAVLIGNSGGDDTTIPRATITLAGVMAAADKSKLDGIAPGSVAAHANLTGLGNDDHTQYYNQIRGDARYLQDAPADGQAYGRKDNTWSLVSDEGGGGVTSHGDLTGLDADDHPQYIRSDTNDTKTGYLRMMENQQLELGNTGNFEMFSSGGSAYFDMVTGNLYIRDGSTIRYTFDDNGTFSATGDVTAYSDERKKANVKVIRDALHKVRLLRGVTFDRTDCDDRRYTGVIAQDLQMVLPEAVHEDQEGYLHVAYGNVIGLLIEAIKQLEDRVDGLT